MILCRCGQSKNKPFCDGIHNKINFNSEKLEGRQPDQVDNYVGEGITIHDNRGVCSHIGYCTDNLPSVFRMKKEPWIDPDGASVADVIKLIKTCPSGALSYSVDGVKHDTLDRGPSIILRQDGPYHIEGEIELDDYNQSKPQSKEHYTLCRCGGSKNKPFCDGTHWYNNFKHDESKIQTENCQKDPKKEYPLFFKALNQNNLPLITREAQYSRTSNQKCSETVQFYTCDILFLIIDNQQRKTQHVNKNQTQKTNGFHPRSR